MQSITSMQSGSTRAVNPSTGLFDSKQSTGTFLNTEGGGAT